MVDALGGVPAIVQSYLANGMRSLQVEEPERALMALDLLRNDEDCTTSFPMASRGTIMI